MRQAIYLAGDNGVDAAVERGLQQAGCRIYEATSTNEALTLLEYQAERRSNIDALVVLVADIAAGGLALVETMWNRGLRPPSSLLIDRSGADMGQALRAMRGGVREYLLPADDDAKREWRTRKFVEESARRMQSRVSAAPMQQKSVRRVLDPDSILEMRWDADLHTIYLGDRGAVQLSPAEARTFEMLYRHRGRAVGIEELITASLTAERDRDPQREIQLLRTHLARLRRRLASHPGFGYRIENLRGAGYVML
jgi:ActR/RegA family two-component response regulator